MAEHAVRQGSPETIRRRLAPLLAAAGFAAVLLGSAGAQAQCVLGEWDDGGMCTVCACGNYCPDGTNQVACPAGRFNPSVGSSASSACTQCAAGDFSTGGVCACGACSVGFFQPSPGQSSCLACAGGTFAATPGNTVCSECDPGSFAAGSGNTVCTNCSPGTFAAVPASEVCTDCPECNYQPNSGSSACFECACDDGDVCTLDSCDMVDGTCSNDPIAGCGGAVPGLPVGGLLLVAFGMAGAAVLALRPRTS